MANISLRNLDDIVYEQLRVRAAKHGRSMEEEARQILAQAVCAPKVTDVFRKYFGLRNGIDLTITKRKPHEPNGQPLPWHDRSCNTTK